MDHSPPVLDLLSASEEQVRALLVTWGEKPFRAKQLRRWLFEKGATSFDEMTDLPAGLRDRLAAETTLGTLSVVEEQVSTDGTVKRLYRLSDGQVIESVLMRYRDGRRTACISSQAGCAMGCVFCATGQMGLSRQLSSGEIFEQAARFARELTVEGERLSNVVLMGMGEPFHNYDAVIEAIGRLRSDLGIGARKITVSTVGLVPQIRQFAAEGLQVGLAISLHAADDEARSALLPVNRRWNLDELLAACRDYVEVSHRRISFEWALIAGKNDTPAQAHALGRRLKGLLCHVNLIPLNPTRGYEGAPTEEPDAQRFVDILGSYGVPATVRVRRGIDIDAGCGQLKARNQRRARSS